MITNLSRWFAPGLFAVLGSAALIVFTAHGDPAKAVEIPSIPTTALAVPHSAPPRLQTAQTIVQAPAPTTSITVLAPPRIADYWISATRQPGGVIVFDGYVPDSATQQALAATEGADTTWLKLGSGAPPAYQSAIDFGMAALGHMSEGRFALRSNIVTLTGVARSSLDYEALAAMLGAPTPNDLVLARSEILAPAATTFLWSASKVADGTVSLSGMVPNANIREQLVAAAGKSPVQSLMYASGEPADFAASATAGLALMEQLETGKLSFGPAGWSLSGRAKSNLDDIETDIAALKTAGWSLAIEPPPPVAATTPYLWSATRAADGAISFDGLVPTQGLKAFASLRAGQVAADETTIDPSAPKGFVQDVLAALDALALLDNGTITFDGTGWSVTGTTLAETTTDSVSAALSIAATPAKDWKVAVAPAAVTEPEPAATTQAEPATEAEPETETPIPEPAQSTAIADTVEPPAAVDPAYAFSASRSEGAAIIVSGQVPTDPARRYLGVIADNPVTGLTLAEGAPDDFIPSATAGLRALSAMDAGKLTFADGKWSLTGKAPDPAGREALLAEIAALPSAADWALDVAIRPAIDTCRTSLADFSSRNAILFRSGAAIIAPESEPALDELAENLAACPDAIVHIEGHTDADGDDQLNLALSVARAEAVVDALVARSVTPARLYAIGYGESNPIAENDTAAGKRLNRRIVVSVLDEHY